NTWFKGFSCSNKSHASPSSPMLDTRLCNSSSFVAKRTKSTAGISCSCSPNSWMSFSSAERSINTLTSTSSSIFLAISFKFKTRAKYAPTKIRVIVTAQIDATVIQPLRKIFFVPSAICLLNVLSFITVFTSMFVSHNNPVLYCYYTLFHCVNNFLTVCCHNNRCSAVIYLFKYLHNFPLRNSISFSRCFIHYDLYRICYNFICYL